MKFNFSRLTSLVCLVALSLFVVNSNAQTYCTPTFFQGCAFGTEVNDFYLNGELGTSFNDPATGCPTTSGPFGGYEDRTSESPVTLYPSHTYTVSTDDALTLPSTVGADGLQIWIDFNGDGTFDATEVVGGGTMPYPSALTNYPITIPSTATAGTFRMRVEVSAGVAYPNLDPCPAGTPPTAAQGEVHDYMVTIQTGTVTACSSPTLTLGATTCSSQVINWTAVTGATGYEYVVNTTSGAPGAAGTATTLLTYTATGLTASTLYYAHVRTNCGSGSFSSWTTISFTTGAGPAAITGTASVCPGGTTHLSDATASGVWSSSNTAVATISASGVVYGITAGSTNISYTAAGCASGLVITVAPMPAITGGNTVCPGGTTNLSDATTGGVWSSSNTTAATISGLGVVYGIAAGTTNISYSAGGCTTGITVTVGSLPAITGTTSVCPGSTTHLSDTSPGGVWSSSNSTAATVSGGVVYGANPGTTVITYAIGSCMATATVTVAALPAITGGNTVCAGSTLALSDATSGGIWSSSTTNIATVSGSGVVSGVAAGGTTITYALGGCSTTLAVTVGNSLGAISGTTSFCVTSTTTLSDPTPGGVWSSGNISVATVSGTVTVHGVSGGTATISYSLGGCSVTSVVTVVPNNGGTITGNDTVCIGTPITISDSQPGGTWSSSNTSRAMVNPSTGVVTGVSAGTFTISYTVTNLCGTYTVTRNMRVLTAAQCLAGVTLVASGPNTELKVFPNPNNGAFTMNLVSDDNEEVHVMITNIVGQKVKEFVTTTNNTVEVKLDHAAGIYLLSAMTAHGKYIFKVEINPQ